MSPRKNKTKKDSPASKKLNVKSKLKEPVEENISKFKDILNRKFKVYRVSPIYNFSSVQLKIYERKLNEALNSKKSGICNNVYKSKFSLNKNLRLNDKCAEALQVEITKNESQKVYSGHFISWNDLTPDENSVFLPILLVEAKAYIVYEVHSFLCKMFDCDIQPVSFSFEALISFLVKLLESPRNSVDVSQAQVTMEYKVPECEVKDKIKISLYLEATTVVFAVVMDSLREKCQEITNMEIIWEFYNKLLNHIYHIFKIDFIFAELLKISFPDALLTADGQVKMSTDDAATNTLCILEHFTPLDAVITLPQFYLGLLWHIFSLTVQLLAQLLQDFQGKEEIFKKKELCF